MERRDFLKAGLVLGGAAALGGCRLFPIPPSPGARTHSIIDGAPGDSGIDTVVICMMENRSFDSYLGWLARDDGYLEQGRKRYGNGFTVHGDQFQTYVDPLGNAVDTYRRVLYPEDSPFRGCDFGDPGHGWTQGRAQRDGGFLAPGSRNDLLALSYFEGQDLPMYSALGAPVPRVRRLARVAARADQPQPPVPAVRAVGRHDQQHPAGSQRRFPVGHDHRPVAHGRRFGWRLLQRRPAGWRSSARV